MDPSSLPQARPLNARYAGRGPTYPNVVEARRAEARVAQEAAAAAAAEAEATRKAYADRTAAAWATRKPPPPKRFSGGKRKTRKSKRKTRKTRRQAK